MSFNLVCESCGQEKPSVRIRKKWVRFPDDYTSLHFLCDDCSTRRNKKDLARWKKNYEMEKKTTK